MIKLRTRCSLTRCLFHPAASSRQLYNNYGVAGLVDVDWWSARVTYMSCKSGYRVQLVNFGEEESRRFSAGREYPVI